MEKKSAKAECPAYQAREETEHGFSAVATTRLAQLSCCVAWERGNTVLRWRDDPLRVQISNQPTQGGNTWDRKGSRCGSEGQGLVLRVPGVSGLNGPPSSSSLIHTLCLFTGSCPDLTLCPMSGISDSPSGKNFSQKALLHLSLENFPCSFSVPFDLRLLHQSGQ